MNRVYVESPLAGRRNCELQGDAANHIARVLRARAGDPLVLFDGRGGEYAATVESLRKDRVAVAIGGHSPLERESALPITLVQGISRAERMDLVLQKATELGVARIVPIQAERSVVRTDEQKAGRKAAHWRSIAIAACEQCGRNRLPAIDPPTMLAAWLCSRPAVDVALMLSPRADATLRSVARGARSIELLVGPEGGLAPDEEKAVRDAGFLSARLGPRILRTETAALAALAALQSEFGDF
ncbi:MAG TPA: 16S rRNA (uracil(1498)-N(3))-methyltransferase [Steroidobacteraceae bacterium]|nr:16S rRNA (uracil(1498)-N(3))-methyltransferase [Steroidobacteraceae bacterium]